MSRTLDNDIKEQAYDLNPQGQFIWLLTFNPNGAQTVRMTNADEDITFDSIDYESFPFTFEAGEESEDGEITAAFVAVSNIGGAVAALMDKNEGLVDIVVNLKLIAYRGGSTSTTAFLDMNFVTKQATWRGTTATFELGFEDFFRRKIPRNNYSRRFCRWVYKGPQCGYGEQVATVTDATNTAPITIRTLRQHGFENGESVVVAGVAGNTAANGTHTLTYVDEYHFTLNSTTGSGTYTSGGTATVDRSETRAVSAATNASPIVVTVTSPHYLQTGDSVIISGVSGNTAANGSWVITRTGDNTFSLDGSTGSGAYTTGGTVYIDRPTCDKTLSGSRGCRAHSNESRYGGYPAIARPR